MGNDCLHKFRNCGSTDYERLPDRAFISFREWFTYNPFSDTVYHQTQHCGQFLCTLVMLRIMFALTALVVCLLSIFGIVAGALGSSCSNDVHDCESTYMIKLMCYIHVGVYIVVYWLMLWPAAWNPARIRGMLMILFLAYPTAHAWFVHSDVSDECDDYYADHCHKSYNYFKLAKNMDLFLISATAIIELTALVWPTDEEDVAAGTPRVDFSCIDHLYGKENMEWRRPLLVSSKVNEYSGDLKKWQEVVGTRNKSLEEAVHIADTQQENSSDQARLLGKYSSLINETTEKVSRASNMLDEQSDKIGDLNSAVNDVISALGSGSDLSNLSSAFAMTAGDCKAWALVIFLCLLVAVGLLIGVPKWLKLFNISLGISF